MKNKITSVHHEIDSDNSKSEEIKEREEIIERENLQKIYKILNSFISALEKYKDICQINNSIEIKEKVSEFINEVKSIKNHFTKIEMIHNISEDSHNNKIAEKVDNEDVSIIIADSQGIIHSFNKITPKMFHVRKEALRGKNYFQLISSYSRKFLYETFGNNVFKTFKETSRTIRYSLPHMDDVDKEHFFVITSKISLVKSKVSSPLKPEPFMIKICSRVSSETIKLILLFL